MAGVHAPCHCKTRDLGKFSNNPDKYIEALQNLTYVFKLTRKDVMLLLNQTLSEEGKCGVLATVERTGTNS